MAWHSEGTAKDEPQLDICDLFGYYNDIYFSDALGSCIVKWSGRLTRVAGSCFYHKGGRCEIHLSESLLKRHCDNDLKNTLLHEMIHAFLWNAENNRNHSYHGPSFKTLMDHINSNTVADNQRPPSGYDITIYHRYHDETDSCKAHHWMCVSCGDLIKRSVNRGPSPYDCFKRLGHQESCGSVCHWHEHNRLCGSHYIKVAEPTGYKDKKSKRSDDESPGGLLCLPCPSSGQKQTKKGSEELDEDWPGGLLYLPSQSSSSKQEAERKENDADIRRSKRILKFSAAPNESSSEKLLKDQPGSLLCLLSKSGSSKQEAIAKDSLSYGRSKSVSIKTSSCSKLDGYTSEKNAKQKFAKPVKLKGSNHEFPSEKPKRVAKSTAKNVSEFPGECRKRCNVIIKCLNYFSDELTDEDIEPLLNKRTERRKKQKLLVKEASSGGYTNRSLALLCYKRVGRLKRQKVNERREELHDSGSADAAIQIPRNQGFSKGNNTTMPVAETMKGSEGQNRASEDMVLFSSPERVNIIDISEDEWSTD